MSGVAVVRGLLASNSALIAIVPAARIQAGYLPVTTSMPAIEVRSISVVVNSSIRVNEAVKLYDERVQVTALNKGTATGGSGYPVTKSLIPLILAACPCTYGTVNGVSVQSIVPDGIGPDLSDADSDLYSQSIDFLVRWVA